MTPRAFAMKKHIKCVEIGMRVRKKIRVMRAKYEGGGGIRIFG